MIAGNAHPQTGVYAILHEEASAVIVDVQCTNTVSLSGKDGILLGCGRTIMTSRLVVDNIGEPVLLRATEEVLPGIYWTLSSNGSPAGYTAACRYGESGALCNIFTGACYIPGDCNITTTTAGC